MPRRIRAAAAAVEASADTLRALAASIAQYGVQVTLVQTWPPKIHIEIASPEVEPENVRPDGG